MNKQVEELMERVRLIDGEIPYDPEDLVSGLSVVPMSAREMEQLLYDTYKKGAKAQLNKVLNDPDLALIVRGHHSLHELVDIMGAGAVTVIPLAEALKEEA